VTVQTKSEPAHRCWRGYEQHHSNTRKRGRRPLKRAAHATATAADCRKNLNQNGHNGTIGGFSKSAPFAVSAPAYGLRYEDVRAVHDEICSRRWENLRLLRLRERRKGRFKGLDQSTWG
jgi:hypothetical protein